MNDDINNPFNACQHREYCRANARMIERERSKTMSDWQPFGNLTAEARAGDWKMLAEAQRKRLDAQHELLGVLRAENAALLARFKDAWEVFQSDFIQAADLDKEHGEAWIISDSSYERIRRKVNAVIGAELYPLPSGVYKQEELEAADQRSAERHAKLNIDPPTRTETRPPCPHCRGMVVRGGPNKPVCRICNGDGYLSI